MAQNQLAMCFKLKVIKQNRLEVYLRYHNSVNINFICFQNKYKRLYIDYKIFIVFGLYDCTFSYLAGIIFYLRKKFLKNAQNQELDVSKVLCNLCIHSCNQNTANKFLTCY